MPFRKSDVGATIDDLRHLALFAKLDNADLHRVAELGEPVEAEAGAHLIEQGDVGTECFLVLEGEAGVFSGDDHVATIGPGSIVGEMALIGHRPRNASVVAQTPMRLLAFDIAAFNRLLDDMPQAKQFVYDTLEARAPRRDA
ncbi:MAG TPA: cyclic nucleotide-binding domain-containing protein [Acidimicrobiales bacterium]|nr:cyclic nucleotide-binding domain-containing protein [Acidimicrobiales bacterium]